jgi:hypothetical protein
LDKKRLVIDLEEAAHRLLMHQAQQRKMTLANYVREALQLPLGRQGVRAETTQVVLPTIEDVDGFYLTESGPASFQVWLPGPNQTKRLVTPTPRFAKAAYATAPDVAYNRLQYAYSNLSSSQPLLLFDVPHTFGPPFRTVRIFGRDQLSGVGGNPITYLATTSRAPYSWIEDLRHGKPGYFLTGLPNASALWQIISCEPDPADRCTFLLSPVRLPHGLPSPDFTKIGDPTLRDEAKLHWSNLEQAVLAHNPHGLVNAAASLSEALLHAFLSDPGPPRSNLSEMLKRLEREIKDGTNAFSPLSYHMMQAVRVMHQSTQHPGRVVHEGRSIRPGFALTIAEGMAEVLTSVGLVLAGAD